MSNKIIKVMALFEALETTKIYSVVGGRVKVLSGLMFQRPFRFPHHVISNVLI